MQGVMASGLAQHPRKKPNGGQAERRTVATLLETWNRASCPFFNKGEKKKILGCCCVSAFQGLPKSHLNLAT